MAMLKIYCDYCKQHWEVYERDNWNSDNARTCPHCFHEIDETIWHENVLRGFGMISDANRELLKDHVGMHRPLFVVNVIEDYHFPNRVKDMLEDDDEG